MCTDYKITGQVTSDGKTVTVPTEKGPFTFEFGTNPQTGFPELKVSGPDGFREIATLLAARGQGGIFVFDPTTGLAKILNGQDISLNRDFATKGISYFGTPDGTRGIPADSLVDLRRSLAYGQSQSNPLDFLAMPSIPSDNPLVALLMLLGVFGAVLAVRAHVPGRKRQR